MGNHGNESGSSAPFQVFRAMTSCLLWAQARFGFSALNHAIGASPFPWLSKPAYFLVIRDGLHSENSRNIRSVSLNT